MCFQHVHCARREPDLTWYGIRLNFSLNVGRSVAIHSDFKVLYGQKITLTCVEKGSSVIRTDVCEP